MTNNHVAGEQIRRGDLIARGLDGRLYKLQHQQNDFPVVGVAMHSVNKDDMLKIMTQGEILVSRIPWWKRLFSRLR